ncbi:lipoyl domain-containing protein [Halobellus limi]|jgi:pyruvate/2-oxoglutarate dehydrogenase complex dihydrolipoamide acyltransferase (E2) component|uniref:Biotin attachment protein n=1 Tax=Halobellus limi TaxID=699433 RepID=A0A1H6AN16_9EURY|nr:lipoyl domain-containing protein [Halobellus limi]QCC47648.1 biotin attachment protein [Halobellus limi]SEG49467.1 Biotin-requiring enzyme [Halobellus limi]
MSGSDDRVPVTADEWADEADSDEGVVVNWFVREGATVEEGESVCEIQIEKVSVDVLAPVAGTLAEIVKGEDDEFERGDTLAWITPSG